MICFLMNQVHLLTVKASFMIKANGQEKNLLPVLGYSCCLFSEAFAI